MTKKDFEELKNQAPYSVKLTNWIGSTPSVVIHTIFFAIIFTLHFFGVSLDSVMLILTTAVSLEAIYLSIFIQMSVNRNTQSLEEVEEDIDEIQEDVEEVQKDVDVIQENVEEVQKDIGEIQEDVEEVQKEIQEEEVPADVLNTKKSLDKIELTLQALIKDIETLKNQQK